MILISLQVADDDTVVKVCHLGLEAEKPSKVARCRFVLFKKKNISVFVVSLKLL